MYISCAPKAAEKNWIDLARPCSKSLKGEPFILTQAVGVDMFPHTDHKEMVLLFERHVKTIAPPEPEQPEPQVAAAANDGISDTGDGSLAPNDNQCDENN